MRSLVGRLALLNRPAGSCLPSSEVLSSEGEPPTGVCLATHHIHVCIQIQFHHFAHSDSEDHMDGKLAVQTGAAG